MTRVALIVIYNHKFDQNIEVVERIYRSRFSNIFHLVPFYTGKKPNVIPVYENSYYFQGFIASALPFFNHDDFSHYLFIADDLIVNSDIDENNLFEKMQIPPGHCFMPGWYVYHQNQRRAWGRVASAYEWNMAPVGLQAVDELPEPQEALSRLRRHHLDARPLKFEQVWQLPQGGKEWLTRAVRDPLFCLRYLKATLTQRRYELPYPLVGGYSDIFLVTKEVIGTFSHFCGVFSAMRLFVEHAIPTALALSATHIATSHGKALQGKAMWTRDDLNELDVFDRSLNSLLDKFPSGYLFLHPIKLSQWINDLDAELIDTSLSGEGLLKLATHMHQVTNCRASSDGLEFDSIGNDPYLHFRDLSVERGKQSLVSISIVVPAETEIQLFYQLDGDIGFCEHKSLRKAVQKGRHTFALPLPVGWNGRLRLDPGNVPGPYRLNYITIYQ